MVVEGETIGEIGPGLLILVGIHASDDTRTLDWMAKKCAQLRVFGDAEGKMNLSLLDTKQDALVVSQFTLYADARKGNRPSYIDAAPPEIASPRVDEFAAKLSQILGRPVERGRFGADMKVELVNDGPVTIWLQRDATDS